MAHDVNNSCHSSNSKRKISKRHSFPHEQNPGLGIFSIDLEIYSSIVDPSIATCMKMMYFFRFPNQRRFCRTGGRLFRWEDRSGVQWDTTLADNKLTFDYSTRVPIPYWQLLLYASLLEMTGNFRLYGICVFALWRILLIFIWHWGGNLRLLGHRYNFWVHRLM